MIEEDRLFLEVIKITSLLDLSLAVNSRLTLDNIFDATHDTLFANFRTEEMALFMQRDPLDRHFSMQASFGNKPYSEKTIADDGALAMYFMKQKEPLLVSEVNEKIKSGLDNIAGFAIEIIVPCFIKEELTGFLFMGKHPGDEYKKEHRMYLRHLGRILGTALENAQLMKAATFDSKTGLYLYQAAEARISKEIYRASRYQHALSLIILDIDHFKDLNDQYGHVAGDKVLAQYGELLLKAIRESDIAARYGGEEFLIACPHLSIDAAYKLANRIKSMVEEYDFDTGSETIKSTISIGISGYMHNEGQNFESLVDIADRALYRSKNEGRNRITIGPVQPAE